VFKYDGNTWVQEAKLIAQDGFAYDWFGCSVSLFGDTALVGAAADDDNGLDSGSAYVFRRNGTTWEFWAKLHAPDGAAGDEFGYSVSLFGDTALVGAPGDDDNDVDSGSAYIIYLIDTILPHCKITRPIEFRWYLFDKELPNWPIKMPLVIGKITIEVDAWDLETYVYKVEFYIDNVLRNTLYNQPWKWTCYERRWIPTLMNIKVIAYDKADNPAGYEITVLKIM
jgi:hypothetical protein